MWGDPGAISFRPHIAAGTPLPQGAAFQPTKARQRLQSQAGVVGVVVRVLARVVAGAPDPGEPHGAIAARLRIHPKTPAG